MKIFFQCFFLLSVQGIFGQSNPNSWKPEIGKRVPDFTSEVVHYSRKKISLSDFKGKHVILDFWSIGCTACIEGFKKMNPLQNKFGNKLQFILIGQDHFGQAKSTKIARSVFEKYRDRWKLDLPAIFDGDLFTRFNVPFVPYYIWIDENGIVKALTSVGEVNETNIANFLQGKDIKMINRISNVPDSLFIPFDYDKPLLINGNGGKDTEFLYRSILAQWNTASPAYRQTFVTSTTETSAGKVFWAGVEKNRVQMNGVSLMSLIEVAYGDTVSHSPPVFTVRDTETQKYMEQSSYGKFWREPLLELQDSSEFDFNWITGRNLYSYSLIVPPTRASAAFLKVVMQRDLSIYFEYDITVETRLMPCWYLTASDEARVRLKTKSGKLERINEPGEMKIRNLPFYQVIRQIFEYHPFQPPIIDNTGITDRIDLDLHIAMMDFEDVKKGLREQGLYLEKGKREMKVIVVRDKKQ